MTDDDGRTDDQGPGLITARALAGPSNLCPSVDHPARKASRGGENGR